MNASLDVSFRTIGFVSDEPGGSLHGTLGPVNMARKNCDSRKKKRRCTLKTTSSAWKRNRQQGKGGAAQVWRRAYPKRDICLWEKVIRMALSPGCIACRRVGRHRPDSAYGGWEDVYDDTVLKRPPQ